MTCGFRFCGQIMLPFIYRPMWHIELTIIIIIIIIINIMDLTSLIRSFSRVTTVLARLHPSWPQIKRLYKPWTKDYRHTRQDRWIQTELAFTLPKNATKPNPDEIIPLQTTRKEKNWKTEKIELTIQIKITF